MKIGSNMDEIKNNQQPQNGQNSQNGQQKGGRSRRHRHHKGHGGNKPNQGGQNNQTAQNQGGNNNQNGQKQGNPNKQKQPQNGQNGKQKQQKQPQKPQQPQQKQPQPQQQKQKQKQKQGGNNNQNSQNNQGGQNKNQNRKDTYLYVLDGNLYVNLTNKCSNACDFCVRNECDSYYGHYLWLKNGDVTAEKVIASAKDFNLSQYKEAVFCGFGEPTYKMKEMLALCDFFHEKGLKTRLNTNGQGSLINKRDIAPELKDKIDFVNISLNFSCAEKYQPVCRSQFGANGFDGLLDFARQCQKNDIPCRFSIVDCIGEEEVEACKRLAESLRIPLYVRDYITDSGE